MKYFIATLLLLAQLAMQSARANEMPPVPKNFNATDIWNRYCNASGKVERLSLDIPQPNYKTDAVRSAATRLVQISPFSYYFYSGPLSAYRLVTYEKGADGKSVRNLAAPPADFKINADVDGQAVVINKLGRENAHAFLTVLCGEFRDRPSLIADKVKWVNRMYTLRDTKQNLFNTGMNDNVWGQLSAHSYKKYIQTTRQIFASKQKAARLVKNEGSDGEQHEEREGVKPFSVCETKFIMAEFVSGVKSLPMEKPKAKKLNAHAGTMMPKPPAGGTAGEQEQVEEQVEEDDGADQDDQGNWYDRGVDLKEYKNQLADFKNPKKGNCQPEDNDYFYDFRGDSNFKPNSPESNGMIWYSSTIGGACMRNKTDNGFTFKKGTEAQFAEDPAICEKYFKEPFKYRWSAARAGLATWIMHDPQYNSIFDESNANVTVMPHLKPMEKPFGYRFVAEELYKPELYVPYEKNEQGQYFTEKYVVNKETGEGDYKQFVLEGKELEDAMIEMKEAEVQYAAALVQYEKDLANRPGPDPISKFNLLFTEKQQEFWKREDLGFNEIFQVSKDTKHKTGDAFVKIRNAVNRHTDWYASAYDDGTKNADGTAKIRDQAYSPFVASSYEMSASDGFTAPGVTVSSPADGCKHWMFIFKMPMKNWMSYEKLQAGERVNFNSQWFDETSFGTNSLADSERALDRLGTALENEMDSILYLNNITTSGKVDEKCGEDKVATFN